MLDAAPKQPRKEAFMSGLGLLVTGVVSASVSIIVVVMLSLYAGGSVVQSAAHAQSSVPVLRAERLEIVDSQGSVVVRLGSQNSSAPATGDAPSLVFLDQHGQ